MRHEGRLADRALDFTLRRKANLYSNERRAVAERVYALLRRQRTWTTCSARAPGLRARYPPRRQDLLRLRASRVLHGEDAAHGGRDRRRSTARTPSALGALPDAAAALDTLPAQRRFPSRPRCPTSSPQRFRGEFGERAPRRRARR